MRYTLSEDKIKPVRYIRHNGLTISNPPDELVDELGLGYPLVEDETLEYDPDTQEIVEQYTLIDGVIHKTYTAQELPYSEADDMREALSELGVDPDAEEAGDMREALNLLGIIPEEE